MNTVDFCSLLYIIKGRGEKIGFVSISKEVFFQHNKKLKIPMFFLSSIMQTFNVRMKKILLCLLPVYIFQNEMPAITIFWTPLWNLKAFPIFLWYYNFTKSTANVIIHKLHGEQFLWNRN